MATKNVIVNIRPVELLFVTLHVRSRKTVRKFVLKLTFFRKNVHTLMPCTSNTGKKLKNWMQNPIYTFDPPPINWLSYKNTKHLKWKKSKNVCTCNGVCVWGGGCHKAATTKHLKLTNLGGNATGRYVTLTCVFVYIVNSFAEEVRSRDEIYVTMFKYVQNNWWNVLGSRVSSEIKWLSWRLWRLKWTCS